MRANVIVYSFLISIGIHLLLFVPWTSSQKIEQKPETIPVAYRTIAKKETQPPAPEKAKDEPKRAKGLPQPKPAALNPPAPTPPPPTPAAKPTVAQEPVAVAKNSPPPPPPPPEPEIKPEPAPEPPPKEIPAPVAKKIPPAKEATKPPERKVVEKKVTKPPPKPAEVKKKARKPEPKKARKPPAKKRVAKKQPEKRKAPKKTARKRPPPQKTAKAKKPLPTLKELLPPVSGSMSSGSHGNEYISMDSRDPKYSSWLASLQRAIYRTWLPSYPSANIRGEVLLGLMIRKDGDLAHIEVLHSSGLVMLDRHAMEAVRAAAPFDRFPPWMTQSEQGIKATFTYGGTPGNVWSWER